LEPVAKETSHVASAVELDGTQNRQNNEVKVKIFFEWILVKNCQAGVPGDRQDAKVFYYWRKGVLHTPFQESVVVYILLHRHFLHGKVGILIFGHGVLLNT
jgi:hypothetical protein